MYIKKKEYNNKKSLISVELAVTDKTGKLLYGADVKADDSITFYRDVPAGYREQMQISSITQLIDLIKEAKKIINKGE